MKRNWIWLLIVAVIVVGGVAYVLQQNPPTTPTQTQPQSSTTNEGQTTSPPQTTTTPAQQDASSTSTTTPTTDTTSTTTTTPPAQTDTSSTAPAMEIKNPGTLIVADVSDIDTLDPHFIYDTSSGEIVFHVYDNLIAYDGPYADRFVPMLSTDVPSVENGLIQENPDGTVILSFPLRQGIKFHNGNDLTPEDVAFSFHRLMLLDRANGPSWLVLDPLLGVNTVEDLARQIESQRTGQAAADIDFDAVGAETLVETCNRVKQTVQVEEGNVEFHLPRAFPPFLSILSQSASWAAVMDKEWVAEQGDWNGDCATWQTYHDPQKENDPLYEKMNGTGPFKLEYWDHNSGDISIVRNESYWREPAQLERVVIKKVNEWSTRKLLLQNGDADIASVPRQYIDQVDGTPGVRMIKGQVQMSIGYLFFSQQITAEGNDYIGSGQLDGEGIPPDFFTDLDVRKGFNYVFDWETFIEQARKGEAEQARGPIPNGVPYYNPNGPIYTFDLAKAEEHFKQAWGGQLWDKGFKFIALYVSGGDVAKTMLEIVKRNLARVNEKFQMEVLNVEWSTLLSQRVERRVPLSVGYWLEDYHDAHNWLFPLMHSQGTYGLEMGLDGRYDALIDRAVDELDPQKRQELYYQLQQMAYDDAVVVFTEQPLGRHYQRDWVNGYYYNPIWPGRNFYAMSKQLDAKPNQTYVEAQGLTVLQW